MSEYGDGGYVSVSRTEKRRARIAHTCHACREEIRPGQLYYSTFYVFDGNPHSFARCERCEAIYDHLSERLRKEGDPEEYCNDRLNCGHEYKERWNEEPPPQIAALAFWIPGDPLPTAGEDHK